MIPRSALSLALAFGLALPAAAATREGVRVLGEIRFYDFDKDGVEDWLVGRAECFTKPEGQAEVTSPCVAILDGRGWAPLWRKNVPRFGLFPPAVAGSWIAIDVGEPLFSAYATGRSDLFWEFRMDGEHSAAMTPIGRRLLVIVGGDHVYLIDPEERRSVWDQRLWAPVELPPVVVDRFTAIATNRELVVFDVEDGKIAWRLRGTVSSLHRAGQDGLFVASRDGDEPHTIALLDAASGASRWRRDSIAHLQAPLQVGQDHLYAFGVKEVLAFDRRNGRTAWRARVPPRTTPLATDSFAVVAMVQTPATPQELVAFDRETGKRLWSKKLTARRYEPHGWMQHGLLVLWSRDASLAGKSKGKVEASSSATGRVRWEWEADEKLVGLLSVGPREIRVQRERGFTLLDTERGTELARRRPIALARVEKSLSDRLRYFVYVLPPLLILVGIVVWVRRRFRRAR